MAILDLDLDAPRNLFIDNGERNPTYVRVPADGMQLGVPTAASGEELTIQVQSGSRGDPAGYGLQTVMFYSVHRPGLSASTPASAIRRPGS